MTLLKDLLALRQEHERVQEEEQIDEARGDSSIGSALMDKFMDANKAYSWEGSRGRRNLEKLIGDLGYRSLEDFFDDNSGGLEALVEWISTANVSEWKQKMAEKYGDESDED